MANNYSGSKCPKSEQTSFETVIETPTNSKYKLQFVRCSFCKTIVSTKDYFNIGAMLEKILHKFDIRN